MSKNQPPTAPLPQPRARPKGRNYSPGEQHNVSSVYPDREPAYPHVPDEILQTIFRNLEFYDLVRCQAVSDAWAAALPGNDLVLRRRLFTSTNTVHKAKSTDKIPTAQYQLRLQTFTSINYGALPDIRCALTMKNEYFRRINMPRGLTFHPIVRKLGFFMHVVNPFFEHGDNCKPEDKPTIEPFIGFCSLDELDYQVTDIEYENGTWENHLMCIPALEQVKVTLRWHREEKVSRTCVSKKMEKGVTMGEFVDTVRKALEFAVEDVKKFTHTMEPTLCDHCEMSTSYERDYDSTCDEEEEDDESEDAEDDSEDEDEDDDE